MDTSKSGLLLYLCVWLLCCETLVEMKKTHKPLDENKRTKRPPQDAQIAPYDTQSGVQQDTIFLSFHRIDSSTPQNYSCASLSVSGFTELSVPPQAMPPHLTCSCLIRDTLFVVVEKRENNKKHFCNSDSCSEPDPQTDSLDVRVRVSGEGMEVQDEMGNTFSYVNAMDKKLNILFYYQDQDIECDLEVTPDPTMSPLPESPPPVPPVEGDHSHSLIVMALVGSVLINLLIILVAALLYHRLSASRLQKKVPGMVSAAMQLTHNPLGGATGVQLTHNPLGGANMQHHTENSPLNAEYTNKPNSPGYTPLGRLNPLAQDGEDADTMQAQEDTYGANYSACQGRSLDPTSYGPLGPKNYGHLPPTSYDHLVRLNPAASMSDVSSLVVPSTGNTSLANSRTNMLSVSTGNLTDPSQPGKSSDLDIQIPTGPRVAPRSHANNLDIQTPTGPRVAPRSPANNLDTHVPTEVEVKAKQAAALPPIPNRVSLVLRDNSRTSNSYDYIEYDAMPGSDQVNREPSHKYLQIT